MAKKDDNDPAGCHAAFKGVVRGHGGMTHSSDMGKHNPPIAPNRTTNRGDNWIAGATQNKGGLHRSLGIPIGQKIPTAKIAKAAGMGGKVGKQARLAQTLSKLRGR